MASAGKAYAAYWDSPYIPNFAKRFEVHIPYNSPNSSQRNPFMRPQHSLRFCHGNYKRYRPVFLLICSAKGLNTYAFSPNTFSINSTVLSTTSPSQLYSFHESAKLSLNLAPPFAWSASFYCHPLTLITWLLGRAQHLTPARAGAFMQVVFAATVYSWVYPSFCTFAGTPIPTPNNSPPL